MWQKNTGKWRSFRNYPDEIRQGNSLFVLVRGPRGSRKQNTLFVGKSDGVMPAPVKTQKRVY
jgi:hypothetical protein